MQIELAPSPFSDQQIGSAYYSFFEANPQPMWLLDPDTLRFTGVNQAAVHMYGYSSSAFLGMSVLDIQGLDGIQAFLKAWYHPPDSSAGALPGEWNHVTANGNTLTVELLRRRVDFRGKDEELVICRDITSRKQVEACLAVRYALTRVLSEAPAGSISKILQGLSTGLGFEAAELWLVDPSSGTLQRQATWSNPAIEKSGNAVPTATAYLNPRLLANICQSGSAVWTPESSFETGWGIDWNMRATGIHGAFSFAVRRRGENCGVVVLFSRSAEPPGQPICDLIADIGGQIGQSIERSQTEERLRILSSVVEQSPVSIVVTDLKGEIEYVNSRATELTGYRADELIGKNPRILKSGETSAEAYRDLWGTISRGGEWRGTFHNKKKNGELFWEAARIRCIRDASGAPAHYLAVKEDITARKEMERALKDSEERFRMAATNSSDVIYEWDLATDCTQIFGGNRGQLGASTQSHPKTSTEYRQMIHPEDRKRLIAAVDRHLETGAPFSEEYRLVYPGGDIHYVSDEGAAVRDAAGKPYKWIGVIRDITGQRMAELSKAQLAAIVESAKAAIISRDLSGNVLTWNTGAERIFGYSASERIGRGMDVLYPPDRPEEGQALIDQIRRGEVVDQFETVRLTKAGQPIHVLTSMSPIRDFCGALIGVSQVVWDITERKQAELALAQSEERLRLVTETISEVFWMADIELTKMFYISPAYEKVWGRSRESLYRNPRSFLDAIHPDDLAQTCGYIQNQQAQQLPLDHEYRVVQPEGSTRWIWNRGFPVRDGAGNVSRYAGVALDITYRKDLERHLMQAQRLESIGQLAAGIAHEINTPIQYIGDNGKFLETAFCDLMRMLESPVPGRDNTGMDSNPEDLDYLRKEIPCAIEQLLDGVNRVADIVRAMKEFAHPGVVEKAPLDINRAIESTILVSRNEWKYVAELTTDLDSSLLPIPFIAREFNQVILNMIVNAAHAIASVTGERGGKGLIRITTRAKLSQVEIRVSDTGCGIPEAIRSKVFDPFFTTKPVGKGTGQGLAIAHSIIVQKHGGTIQIESEPGQGTTFIIQLPVSDDAPLAT